MTDPRSVSDPLEATIRRWIGEVTANGAMSGIACEGILKAVRAALRGQSAELNFCVHCGGNEYGKADDACWWCYMIAKQTAETAIEELNLLRGVPSLSGDGSPQESDAISVELDAVFPDGSTPPPAQRVFVVELDGMPHKIFATQDAADSYCQTRRRPEEYEVVKWAVTR